MYLMKDVCKMTGMSYETLKYYCNEGLIPNVKRDRNNYRLFDDGDITWINSLACLKKCGMGISEMKEYVRLCLEGEASIPERKVILEKKERLCWRSWKKFMNVLNILIQSKIIMMIN